MLYSTIEVDGFCNALSIFQTMNGVQQTPCIRWRAYQVCRFLERFKVFEGKHDDRLISVPCNDDRRVIIADPVHGRRQILTGRRVRDRVHMDSIPYRPFGVNVCFCRAFVRRRLTDPFTGSADAREENLNSEGREFSPRAPAKFGKCEQEWLRT